MQRHLMKSKLHGGVITQCDLEYEGSLTLDRNLMELADLVPHERVQVVNVNTGDRFDTYVIEGEAGAGTIAANGGCARLCAAGDKVLVISYVVLEDEESKGYEPKVILLDERNQPKG